MYGAERQGGQGIFVSKKEGSKISTTLRAWFVPCNGERCRERQEVKDFHLEDVGEWLNRGGEWGGGHGRREGGEGGGGERSLGGDAASRLAWR